MADKCKLCQQNDLDGIGSHIFTESVIRTAVNEDGVLKRANKEIVFSVSSENIGLSYFGQSVLPEKIEKITGKKVSQELLDNNAHPFVNKNLVCSTCEKKFGPVESAFAELIYSKIVQRRNSDLKKDTCNYVAFSEKEKWVAHQFALINIWRASASKYDEWQLKPEEEERVRQFVLKTVDGNIDEIIDKAKHYHSELGNFEFALNYFIQEGENLSENGVLIDNNVNPYFFLLNRLSILFDFNGLKNFKPPLIVEDIIEQNIACIINNSKSDELKIGINSDKDRKLLFSRIGKKIYNQMIERFNSTFLQAHYNFFGFSPSSNVIDYYNEKMARYINEKKGMVDISEMMHLSSQILIDCARSYFG